MKRIISFIIILCSLLALAACDENDGTKQTVPSEPDPRFYVPAEHKIFDEDGDLIFTRTVEFDSNGFMSKIDTVFSGFRYENRHETINISNDFDDSSMKLTQTLTISVDGTDSTYSYKYVWSFDTEMNVLGMSCFSQGEEHYEEYSITLDSLVWLEPDGSFYTIDGESYPTPTVSPDINDDGFIRAIIINYSDAALSDNAYVSKIKEVLVKEYGPELAEYAELDEYVAYYTLWGAISRKEGDTVITELKYENGTVAERITWKNATPEEFASFQLLDWDWFGDGALDFTSFRFAYRLYPPYYPSDYE